MRMEYCWKCKVVVWILCCFVIAVAVFKATFWYNFMVKVINFMDQRHFITMPEPLSLKTAYMLEKKSIFFFCKLKLMTTENKHNLSFSSTKLLQKVEKQKYFFTEQNGLSDKYSSSPISNQNVESMRLLYRVWKQPDFSRKPIVGTSFR